VQLAVLATSPDDEVSHQVGQSPTAVQAMRTKRGIPNPDSSRGHRWLEGGLALLGIAGNHAIAALANWSAMVVRPKWARLGIPNPTGHGEAGAKQTLLGTAPGYEVAARIGRTEGAMTLKRCRLRIPTFCDRRRETRQGPQR
jgi:hypothetical protein